VSYSITNSGARFQGGFSGGGQFNFRDCTFGAGTGFVFDSTSYTDSLSFHGCNFETCVLNSFYIGGSCRALAFVGCRTEGCLGDDFQINPTEGNRVDGLVVTGTSFTANTAASKPIVIGGAGGKVRGLAITGNQVEYAAAGTAFVYLNGDGESGLIAGNSFAQPDTAPVNTQRAGVVVFANENSSGKCAEYWGLADWGAAQGSWTPVDGSGAGLTLAVAGGRFTKVGRMVMWQASIQYPVNASPASAEIGGLPFAIGGLTGATEGRAGARVDVSNAGIAIGILQGMSNPGNLAFCNPTSAAGLTNAALSGKSIWCSGAYSL
jgi:hypothetical protein